MTSPVTNLLLGDSVAMRNVRGLIESYGPTRLNVLLEGPTGSGKELAANAIHAESGRRGKLVSLNVSAIPDAMFEDALFGHVRGAFSGAVADHDGYLQEADGGTVFLDEVSALAPTCQAKLLRALETRQFRPVGAARDQRSDFRLVSATNVNLSVLIAGGLFRADLAHRLGTAVVRLPALCERMDDLPALVGGILAQVESSRTLTLGAGALVPLQAYRWPGNVRELRSVLERSAALARSGLIGRGDVESALQNGDGIPNLQLLRNERDLGRMVDALNETEWNVVAAALALGVHRATLYRRIQRLGLMAPPARHRSSDPARSEECSA